LLSTFSFSFAYLVSVLSFMQNHPDAKGLFGVQFPYYDLLLAIYGKYIATGEGAEDMSDAVNNMEQELAVGVGNSNNEEEEEDMTSRETPRWSFDSTSSSSKKHKKWKGKGRVVYKMTHFLTCSMK
jgi:hypothetical protein